MRCEQEVLGRDVLVLELVGFFERLAENLLQSRPHVDLRRALHFGQVGQRAVHRQRDLLRPCAQLLQ
jgi:hypothetical protein